MVQEIIVYLILILTAVHLIYKSIGFFKPAKSNGPSCGSGSCSNCSMKFDFDSMHHEHSNHVAQKNKYIQIKKWH